MIQDYKKIIVSFVLPLFKKSQLTMEIKYTIEILTKDIQEIEKLVGMLRNSKDASAIELDLALSKLRNVYEILTLIKADRLHELTNTALAEKPAEEPPAPVSPESEAEATTEPEPVPEPEPEPEPEPQAGSDPEQVKDDSASAILAEKFSAEASINENLAGKLGNDADAKVLGQTIDNISRNIGINDRFLIIRELFEGENERFTSLINELDNAGNYEAANNILKQHFPENMEHEGVEILAGLIKRKYIR
jgi:hypothetical protein